MNKVQYEKETGFHLLVQDVLKRGVENKMKWWNNLDKGSQKILIIWVIALENGLIIGLMGRLCLGG